jgi:ABC-2 type transport system ATP-binding protein
MLSIRNFSKNYSGRLILAIDSLELDRGIYWVKGENGSGKSSLFKSIAGMTPFDGTVTFADGVQLSSHPREFLQRVTYSEAEPLYPSFLTPYDLFRFVGHARNSSIGEQDRFMDQFGIDNYQHQSFQTCSSGMLKKVALALAFLGNPQVIILDEPLTTLDHEAQNIVMNLITQTSNSRPVVFLLSSHQSFITTPLTITGIYHLQNQKLISVSESSSLVRDSI